MEPPLFVGYHADEYSLLLLTALGADGRASLIRQALSFDPIDLARRDDAFWNGYWHSVHATWAADEMADAIN